MRLYPISAAVFALPLLLAGAPAKTVKNKLLITPAPKVAVTATVLESPDFYTTWNLNLYGLSKQAFEFAVKGYNYLQTKNSLKKLNILTIIDYSLPSTQKRLYVLDMTAGKMLFHSLIAHGKNSGVLFAEDFSNEISSLKTSLGFFVTGSTYTGSNGYSLKLDGYEKGINDNAMQRAIVMHGADYVNEDFIEQKGYLGRSHGCPALPEKITKKLIDVIKGGSCLFLYHPQKDYINQSKILNNPA